MARESTNPALTRIPAFNGQSRGYPPPPTPPSGGPTPSPGSAPGTGYAPPPSGIDYEHPSRGQRDPLEVGFDRPPAGPVDTGRMTVDDVVMKTSIMLGTVFVAAAITWVADLTALFFPALFVTLGLSLWITFKQVTAPAAHLGFAVAEGIFAGSFSKIIATWVSPGAGEALVLQALIGTAGVAAAMLFLYKSGRIRVTPQFQRMVILATAGFFILMLANLVFFLFTDDLGLRGMNGLGLVVGLFAVGLASMNLVLDFDFIEKSVRQGVPERYSWLAAFGLTVTLVWLYMEILRILAILQGRD
jgi:uncharacterized YccA/Bax inhibitor family protein